MIHTTTEWAEAVLHEIRASAGAELASQFERAWNRHAERRLPEITLVGPYDSGKSSLLKRLLVEAGQPTPPWLTISARRETFELSEVDALGCTFTDTPGLAGGDEQHERLAVDALSLTDAFMLVLPPQLATSEPERIADIIAGRFYDPERGWNYPKGAFLLVVARMDEAGLDPAEDPSGYAALAERKLAEAAELARAAGVERVETVSVAADPYQLVGSTADPDQADYDVGREWDGVRAVVDWVSRVSSRCEELRTAAHVRFLLYVARVVSGHLADQLAATRTALEQANSQLEQRRTFDAELNNAIVAARAELERLLEEELLSLARGQSASEEGFDQLLQDRVGVVLEAWQPRWDAELTSLAVRYGEELEIRARRPTAIAATDLYADVEASQPSLGGGDGEKIKATLDLVRPSLKQGVQGLFEARLGMSFEDAQKQLGVLEALEPEKLKDYWGKPGGFASKEHAKLALGIKRGRSRLQHSPASLRTSAQSGFRSGRSANRTN